MDDAEVEAVSPSAELRLRKRFGSAEGSVGPQAARAKIEEWPRLTLEHAMRIVRDEAAAEDLPSHLDPEDTVGVAAAKAELEKLFTLDNLLSMRGALKERGSLIWRNEVGPMTAESIARMEDKHSDAIFTSCIVMNVGLASPRCLRSERSCRCSGLSMILSFAPSGAEGHQ